MKNAEQFFKGKKVFLTGHTGFKGSWLLAWLHQFGADIKGYALAPENSFDLYNSINGDSICQSVIADVRDKERLKKELLSFQPDFVFHLAAQPLVRLSYEIPVDTFAINALGTAHVLDAIRFLEKPCTAVMITTDKVYHNYETAKFYKEEDKLGGYDPYSASKAAAEIIISSYRDSFFNPLKYKQHKKSVAVARAGNVIGGGDWAKDRIIPDIIKSLSQGEPITVRNPNAVRPWQHVLEPLHGYLVLAAQQTIDPIQFATAYNFGPYPEDNLTVNDLVEKAIAIWGSGNYHTPEIHNAQHEATLLQLDINKALNDLNWKPKLDAVAAIELTINWYKDFISAPGSAHKFLKENIRQYTSL